MTSTTLTYKRLTQNFVAWAQAEPDIRAAVIIGSRARTDHPADEWSDRDILVFARNPDRYVFSAHWIEVIGAPILTFIERTPGGDWERRTLFDGGLDLRPARAGYPAGRERLRLPPRRKNARRTPCARGRPTLNPCRQWEAGHVLVYEITEAASPPGRYPLNRRRQVPVTFLKPQAGIHSDHRPTEAAPSPTAVRYVRHIGRAVRDRLPQIG